jgi:amidohydrolase
LTRFLKNRVEACMRRFLFALIGTAMGVAASPAAAQRPSTGFAAEIDRRVASVMPKVIAWRRDIHQNPELGYEEVRTAKIVADHLRALGMDVKTGVAGTGVVGVLKGGRPGPVVALRADMDALPVTEMVDLPFASRVRTTYNGQDVGVMHACGHDNHVAMLMGVAEILTGMRAQIPGTVKFIFQPAEEWAAGERKSGAPAMIDEGVLDAPAPEAIFGLHVYPEPSGTLAYRAGGFMASSDALRIVVRGRQTHGALPWGGVDPITVAAQIILGLQTIPSRQMDIATAPSIVTIGMIRGGVRHNIIPDSVELVGTIRTLDPEHRTDIHTRIRRTAEQIAQSAGATADVRIDLGAAVTYNDPELTRRMLPTLQRVAGNERVNEIPAQTTAEDFSAFQGKIPGLYFFLGIVPADRDAATAPRNHSPLFFVDEGALPLGVRALAHLALDYLARNPAANQE